MYIPTWILIVAIIIAFYFTIKRFRRIESHLNITDSTQSSGKIPTYDEMLKMGDDDFKKWIVVRSNIANRGKLLEEMIDYETRTHTFARYTGAEITQGKQAVLYVFDKDKSAEAVDYLTQLSKITNEEGEEESDLVLEAILAKAASDHVGLNSETK